MKIKPLLLLLASLFGLFANANIPKPQVTGIVIPSGSTATGTEVEPAATFADYSICLSAVKTQRSFLLREYMQKNSTEVANEKLRVFGQFATWYQHNGKCKVYDPSDGHEFDQSLSAQEGFIAEILEPLKLRGLIVDYKVVEDGLLIKVCRDKRCL